MNISVLAKTAEKYVVANSPRILTAFGVTGTLTTAYLAVKGAFKASDKLHKIEAERALQEIPVPPLDNWDVAKETWKFYIPAVTAGAVTIACIMSANSIGASRYAALAAAYKLSDKSFTEYKDKVREMVGEKKDNDIHAQIAQDRVNAEPPTDYNVISGSGGDTLCLDKWTGRYFRSDMQTIRAAMNDIGMGMYKGDNTATLADFYYVLGIPGPKCADEVGWNTDAPIELRFDTVLGPEDTPVLVMDFATTPFPIHGYFGSP